MDVANARRFNGAAACAVAVPDHRARKILRVSRAARLRDMITVSGVSEPALRENDLALDVRGERRGLRDADDALIDDLPRDDVAKAELDPTWPLRNEAFVG